MLVPQNLVPYLSTAPNPIALALGRVVRGNSKPEGLEACLKAAEVLTRYLAVISLASASSTRPGDLDPPSVLGFDGNLSFGTFELAIRQAINVKWDHPLRDQLRVAMQSSKKRPAVTGPLLERFVRLRNELGHAITHVDEVRAASLLSEYDPIGMLKDCLDDLRAVLAYPLLSVVGQESRRHRLTAKFLFFVGEGDPIPNNIDLKNPVFEWEVLYLCTAAGLIPLNPGLVLLPLSNGRRGVYLIDSIGEDEVRYKSALDNDVAGIGGAQHELSRWLGGFDAGGVVIATPLLEPIACGDGGPLVRFLGEEVLTVGVREPVPQNDGYEVRSVPSFEEAIAGIGLGAAFRDIKFAALQSHLRPEPFLHGVRFVRGDASRVCVVVQLVPGPVLLVRLQVGAFGIVGGDGESFVALQL